jgi:hypothetical protein
VRLTLPPEKLPERTLFDQYSVLLMLLRVDPSAEPPLFVAFAVTCSTGPVPPVVNPVIVSGRYVVPEPMGKV